MSLRIFDRMHFIYMPSCFKLYEYIYAFKIFEIGLGIDYNFKGINRSFLINC